MTAAIFIAGLIIGFLAALAIAADLLANQTLRLQEAERYVPRRDERGRFVSARTTKTDGESA